MVVINDCGTNICCKGTMQYVNDGDVSLNYCLVYITFVACEDVCVGFMGEQCFNLLMKKLMGSE